MLDSFGFIYRCTEAFARHGVPIDACATSEITLSCSLRSKDLNKKLLDELANIAEVRVIDRLAKVCVIGPPTHPDADVDYTFAQVLIDKARVDYNSNCGNMSSAIGPFAVDEGLVAKPRNGEAVVRIHSTNTKKIIVSRFGMDRDEAAVAGDMALDGVAGTGAPIRLEFIEPGGAKTGKLLPTGKAVDQLEVAGGALVTASLVDAANPCVFVPAVAVGDAHIGVRLRVVFETVPSQYERQAVAVAV